MGHGIRALSTKGTKYRGLRLTGLNDLLNLSAKDVGRYDIWRYVAYWVTQIEKFLENCFYDSFAFWYA